MSTTHWTPRLRPMRYEPGEGCPAGPPPAAPTALIPSPRGPDAAALTIEITELLRVALEVLDGRRPREHLRRVFSPRAERYWRALCDQRRQGDQRGPSSHGSRLLRVRLDRPGRHVAEAAAVCTLGGHRVHALAARFEHADTWRCTDIRLL